MQRGLGDERVVVLLRETPRAMQGTRDNAHGLELSTRIADCIFVDRERLGKEFVAILFKARLVGDLAAHYKQAQRQVGARSVRALVEIADALVHEPVKCRRL